MQGIIVITALYFPAPQEVATCLRLLRQHEAFSQLATGVGEPLLQLVVARLGTCQSEVASFGSIIDALGKRPWYIGCVG